MELVDKKEKFLANEEQLRKGFYYRGICSLRVSLPVVLRVGDDKKVKYFLLDSEFQKINSGCILLSPDNEVFVFMVETNSDKKTKANISYRRISFERDDETSTYYLVGSKGFVEAPSEFEKKLREEKVLI